MFAGLTRLFAEPMLLSLLALLPTLALVLWRARRGSARALGIFGALPSVHKLLPKKSRLAFFRNTFFFLALLCLVLAAAGPQWGSALEPARTGNRGDLVIVLDVSRSMLAEQPSRQERAFRSLRDLAKTFARKGGPRVGMVIFAAQAKVIFPLTGDYDHLHYVLSEIDADDLPPVLRPHSEQGSQSGTRIGAGLLTALELLDAKTAGPRDILLLSDGDDPVRDQEYLQGAEAARRRKIPVHVVGFGEPGKDHAVPFRGAELTHNGVRVQTRLQEDLLKEIASRTRGVYIPAHTGNLPLGPLMRDVLASRPVDSSEVDTDVGGLPVLKQQYVLFLGPALALLTLTLLMSSFTAVSLPRRTQLLSRLLIVPLAVLFVSAAHPEAVERLMRQGTDAFEQENYDAALESFENAEGMTSDPGAVAFNKGVTLYKLERYREAELHFKRALEDDVAPASRTARAWFGLGNSLLHQTPGRRQFEVAIGAFRHAQQFADDAVLRADARYNLELARHLWLQAKLDKQDEQDDPKNNPSDPKKDKANETPNDNEKPKQGPKTKGNQGGKDGTAEPGGKDESEKASSGPLTALPDEDRLVHLSQQEAEAHLEQVAQRILRERRGYRRHVQAIPENLKDW